MPHRVFGDGGFGNLNAQLELAVNAWSAPQRGLLRLSIRIRSRTCCGMQGRPGLPPRILHLQNKPKFLRCQATTVSGLTIIRADCQSLHTRRNQTQKIRLAGVSFRRFGHRPTQDGELLPQGEVFQS
jgi:hypothetical protein